MAVYLLSSIIGSAIINTKRLVVLGYFIRKGNGRNDGWTWCSIRLSGFVLCSVTRCYRITRDTASQVGSDTSLSNYCWVNISQTTARQTAGRLR